MFLRLCGVKSFEVWSYKGRGGTPSIKVLPFPSNPRGGRKAWSDHATLMKDILWRQELPGYCGFWRRAKSLKKIQGPPWNAPPPTLGWFPKWGFTGWGFEIAGGDFWQRHLEERHLRNGNAWNWYVLDHFSVVPIFSICPPLACFALWRWCQIRKIDFDSLRKYWR